MTGPEAGASSLLAGRRGSWLVLAAILLATAAILLAMGRPPICTCGTVRLWEGAVQSSENSQQLSDWYSFSHVIHGFLFYAGGWLLLRGCPLATRLTAAVALEAAWEILENSPIIIDRYRSATIALGYTGDSVLNSMSDVAMMMLGFLLASRWPVWITIIVAVGFEALTLWVIRDNLTLNVLMLVWPVEAVRAWQSAGG